MLCNYHRILAIQAKSRRKHCVLPPHASLHVSGATILNTHCPPDHPSLQAAHQHQKRSDSTSTGMRFQAIRHQYDSQTIQEKQAFGVVKQIASVPGKQRTDKARLSSTPWLTVDRAWRAHQGLARSRTQKNCRPPSNSMSDPLLTAKKQG